MKKLIIAIPIAVTALVGCANQEDPTHLATAVATATSVLTARDEIDHALSRVEQHVGEWPEEDQARWRELRVQVDALLAELDRPRDLTTLPTPAEFDLVLARAEALYLDGRALVGPHLHTFGADDRRALEAFGRRHDQLRVAYDAYRATPSADRARELVDAGLELVRLAVGLHQLLP